MPLLCPAEPTCWAQASEHSPGGGRRDPGIRGLEPKPQAVWARQDALWTSCSCPAWPPSSYPIPMAPTFFTGKPQGGPSGQDWGCWTLRVNPTPPLPCPSGPEQCKLQTATHSQLPSGLSQESGQGKTVQDGLNAPRPLLTGLLGWVCPFALHTLSTWHLCGALGEVTLDGTDTLLSLPGPDGELLRVSLHGSHSGGWRSAPMPTCSTHTLLWDRGWGTESLIHALGIQQGTV